MKRVALVILLAACGVQESAPFSQTEVDDVVISRASDLIGITHLKGNLVVHPVMGVKSIELHVLEVVEGSIIIENVSDEFEEGFRLTLPVLESVGRDVSVGQTGSVVTVSLPMLTEISRDLLIDQTVLVNLSAPLLKTLAGDLRVTDAVIAAIDLPSLVTIGGGLSLKRYQNGLEPVELSMPALKTITYDVLLTTGGPTVLDWPQLKSAGGIEVLNGRVTMKAPSLELLDGSLRLVRATMVSTELGALTIVRGDVALTDGRMELSDSISFPSLAEVKGAFSIERMTSLVTIDMPGLTKVEKGLRVADNEELARVTFGGLIVLDSNLDISGCLFPVTLDLPKLVQARGNITIADNVELAFLAEVLAEIGGNLRVTATVLKTFSIPALVVVDHDISFDDVEALTSQPLSFSALTSVAGGLRLRRTLGFSVLSLPLLSTIGSSPGGFPQGSLAVEQNDTLTALSVPSLRTVVSDVTIRRNPFLPRATETMSTVAVGGQRHICGNSDDPACP